METMQTQTNGATAPQIEAGRLVAMPGKAGVPADWIRATPNTRRPVGMVGADGALSPSWWRPMEPRDFLAAFTDFVTGLHCKRSNELLEARQGLRRGEAAANRAFEAMPDFDWAQPVTIAPELAGFLSFALVRESIEKEMPELDDLEFDARRGGDLMGSFDFAAPRVRKFWKRFTFAGGIYGADWRACGFTLDDLKAIQTPEQREAQGIEAPR
jgi:hypothetical protein